LSVEQKWSSLLPEMTKSVEDAGCYQNWPSKLTCDEPHSVQKSSFSLLLFVAICNTEVIMLNYCH